jgi:hypothetical protein
VRCLQDFFSNSHCIITKIATVATCKLSSVDQGVAGYCRVQQMLQCGSLFTMCDLVCGAACFVLAGNLLLAFMLHSCPLQAIPAMLFCGPTGV